jgi:hypothetical protein
MNLRRIVPLCLLVAAGQAFADGGDRKAVMDKEKEAKQSAAPATSGTSGGKQDFVPGGVAQSFVIPKNTCESGVTLQKLLTDKPPSDKPK